MKVGIINYKSGNVQSVENALLHLGHDVERVNTPDQLDHFNVLVLPGVGAFKPAMESLADSGLITPLNDVVKKGETTIIGICLGMQLMCQVSYEHGKHLGLGWIDADVVPIRGFSENIKVPHMGWNEIAFTQMNTHFTLDLNHKDYYFVHSFCVKSHDDNQVVATTEYGTNFASIVRNRNIIGIQFHPEKSQTLGLKLLDQAIMSHGASSNSPRILEGHHA